MKKRVRRGDPQRRQQWQAAVWQWQKSGQSVRDYCRAEIFFIFKLFSLFSSW